MILYLSKYGNLLANLYDKIKQIVCDIKGDAKIRSVQSLLWDNKNNTWQNPIPQDAWKIYENVYTAKIIMDYIRLISGNEFKPQLIMPSRSLSDLLQFANYVQDANKKTPQQIALCEMLIQKAYLERKEKEFASHFNNMSDIAQFIRENEGNDNSIGSTGDYATFSTLYFMLEYFMALYVFRNNCRIVYGESSPQFQSVKEMIANWIQAYNKISLTGSFVDSWKYIFNDILQFNEKLKEIERK